MGGLCGFRPPQFSEDDAWLPPWLQQCSGEELAEKEVHITFEQRVEELLCLQKGISSRESLREEGIYNIGQLFISETESSPFSCAQSADNVVQFHLCLSSDDNSESMIPSTTDACETDPSYPINIQPLETFEILGQKDVSFNTLLKAGAINCSQTAELERHVNKKNVNFFDAAADAVELCVAASEALVINEVIISDSFEKSFSASAILEASLQMKQARLEVCKNTFGGSVPLMGDMDNLSDLDDITMESAYEDVGVHFTELPGNELSVSQVKDTLESEYDEELENKIGASAMVSDKSYHYNNAQRIESVIQINRQPKLAADCGGDTQKKEICNSVCDLGADCGFHNDCSQTVDAQEKRCLSVSVEIVDKPTTESNLHGTNERSSPVMSCRDGEKDGLPNIVQEQFQSRWFGGWPSNNEVKFATVKRSIPGPFVGETSFFSESADAAQDENSFVQNRDKEATIASQLSIPSKNFSNRANDGVLLSQDVGSSSASFMDPLCSVVPCSISENVCSSPAKSHEDPALPRTLDVIQLNKDNLLGTSPPDNMQAEGERMARNTTNINDSQNEVSRQFTILQNYSTMLPSHAMFSEKDSHQKRSIFTAKNAELTFQETNYSNREETVEAGAELRTANKENSPSFPVVVDSRTRHHLPASTAHLKTSVKYLPYENMQWKLSQCKNQGALKLPASKRVETNIPDNNKIQKVQTGSKLCCSTKAAKRSTRSSSHLEFRAHHLDRYLKTNLVKEKKRLIFQNMEFLLTGFSEQKEKEIEGLIRKYGGIVLSQIPSTNFKGKRSSRLKSQVLPVVLCLKKIQSFKFLYGCAVNAYVLRVNWLMDSIAAGFVLPPKRYMILSRNISRRNDQGYTAVKYDTHSLIFNNLGVMLHGKTKHLTNITTIVKHGGGQVFKTLQKLVQTLETGRISMGVVVADEESGASRHLKHCASEKNIPMMSVYWIIKCLYAGKLIPWEEKKKSRSLPVIQLQRNQDSLELSQEI